MTIDQQEVGHLADADEVVPPRLHPAVQVSPPVLRSGRPVHVLKDTRVGGLYRVGEREAFIAGRLDGVRTLGQIDAEYRRQFHRALGPDSWRQIFTLLGARSLLDDGRADAIVLDQLRTSARRLEREQYGLLSRRWSVADPSPFLDAVVRRLPVLTRRPTVAALSVLVTVMAVHVLVSWPGLWRDYQETWREHTAYGLASLAVVVLSLLVHELCHGLATHALGGSCREMGLAWRFPLVTLYSRVDDVTFMPTRAQRVTVSLIGVVGQLVVLLPFWVVVLVAEGGPVRHLAVSVVVTGTMASLVNLVPFLHLDGEKALSHGLGLWDISTETAFHARRLLSRPGDRAPSLASRGQRTAMAAYGAAVVLVGGALLLWTALRWYDLVGSSLSTLQLVLQAAVVLLVWSAIAGLRLRGRRTPATAGRHAGEGRP
ncbi:hypothetical protein O2V63_05800 [Modestobacter sp. VKM Ac-2977]|uniref:hypothetical protein n=1 Tax=Modestobacter sp. VKM Ac-2977 TaxID=3004131 RepID=UPI0022AA97EB|nr:hypothetical protein [Modestobacter sp. VKM Ac-2977]MCZ2819835.1 hypothetical protein [Modestobacter sp. VKM Ac-2977]